MSTKRQPPGRKKIIVARSASRSYVTRGRKNVYWGKFRKGEKPITTDISGRSIRAKNFHSPGLGVIPSGEVYKRKKTSGGDRPYKGTFFNAFTRGFRSKSQTTRAWRGDVSGHAIRTRPPKVSQEAGKMFEPRKLSVSNQRRGPGKPLAGSRPAFRSPSGQISNRPIPAKAPGIGASLINRALAKFKGKKRTSAGISASKGFRNNGQPIPVKAPGIGAKYVDRYQGYNKGRKTLGVQGYGYSGFFKTQRAPKGGGSASARSRNNFGQPINVKSPGLGGRFADIYKGNIKAQKPLKGGGSISGKRWNNFGRPILVKGPGGGSKFADIYRGNIKAQRQAKGGGSISARARNNNGQPVGVKGPGIGGRYVDIYQGNIKFSRKPKGGGSVSNRPRDNFGRPVNVKGPAGIQAKYADVYQGFSKRKAKTYSTDGYDYQGRIKFFKEPKGGGSVSGKLWNNSNRPIVGKAPSSIQAKYADIYQGFTKAHKPLKGGGSVSGKLWNNKEKPIGGKAFPPGSLKVSDYAGDKKMKQYVRNPNQKEEALKKTKPGKSTYLVGNLQIKTKAREYERNPHSSKNALKGESNGKNSVRAIEYSNRIKQLWVKTFGNERDLAGRLPMKKYVHNPNSKKGALMVMAPGRANARIKDLQVNVKMLKPHGSNLHPDSRFAHSQRNNVKQDRTFLMNLKLKWAKLFRKNDTQPAAVKGKVRRPRYDPKERDLWKDLYD